MNVPVAWASVIKTGVQSLPGAGTESIPTFDAVMQQLGGTWFNGADPTRLTVPSGITHVRAFQNLRFLDNSETAGSAFLVFRRNGTIEAHPYGSAQNLVNGSLSSVHAAVPQFELGLFSQIRPVSAGDYFEGRLNVSGAALNTAMGSIRPGSVFTLLGYDGWQGTLLTRASNQTDSAFASTPTKILLNVATIDTAGMADTANSRIVIPSGVSLVRAAVSVSFSGGTAISGVSVDLRKNGASFSDLGGGVSRGYKRQGGRNNSGFANSIYHWRSPVFAVVPGDVFELFGDGVGTGTVPSAVESLRTYFEMEVIA